jgi:hypothetical protein
MKKADTYRFDLIDLKKDRFTYVIAIGPDKKAHILFSSANRALSDKIAMLTIAHNDVSVTPLTTVSSLNAKAGIYQYCVLYSVNPIEIEDVLKRINSEKGYYIDKKIYAVLRDRFIPQATINYTSGDISAKGMMSTGDIIPLYFRIVVKN